MWKAEHAMLSISHPYRSLQDNPQLFVEIFKEHSDLDCKDLFKICQINQNNDRNACTTMLYNHFRIKDPIIWTEMNNLVPVQKQFEWRCLEYRIFLKARKLIEYLECRALWLRNFVDTNSIFKGLMDDIISDNDDNYIQDSSGANFAIRRVSVQLYETNFEPHNNLEIAVTHQEGDFEYMFDFRTIDFESEEEEPFLPESMNSTVDNRDQAALRLAKSLNSWLHQASYIEQITSDVKLTNLLTSDENEPDHIDWDYDFDVTGTPNGQIGYLKVTIPIF